LRITQRHTSNTSEAALRQQMSLCRGDYLHFLVIFWDFIEKSRAAPNLPLHFLPHLPFIISSFYRNHHHQLLLQLLLLQLLLLNMKQRNSSSRCSAAMVVVGIVALMLFGSVEAWGSDGHRIVAQIAQNFLSSKALSAVNTQLVLIAYHHQQDNDNDNTR
jgi:hypothetical protein